MQELSKSRYEIRKATLDDIEAIRRMQAQSWRDSYRNDDIGVTEQWLKDETANWLLPDAMKKSRQHLGECFADATQFYRVALDGDVIVGLIHLDTNDNGTKHLWGLYTVKETHGSGLAQQLWALAREWIGNQECDLEVVSYNERAKAFYRKCGFVDGEEIPELFKDKMPTMHMTRKATR